MARRRHPQDSAVVNGHCPLIIAHRGASWLLPENTSLAVARAIDLGADMVEVDVQLTKDRCPVIFHDWHFGRVGSSPRHSRLALRALGIADLTTDELRLLDVGLWKGKAYAGVTVPTLAELLGEYGRRIAFNLELKIHEDATKPERSALVYRTLDTLACADLIEPVLLSSFDRTVLELCRKSSPAIRLGVLPQKDGTAATLRLADRLEAWSVHLRCAEVRPALVSRIHAAGRRVLAYTADRPRTMHRLMECGIDGIFTNVPDRLAKVVNRKPLTVNRDAQGQVADGHQSLHGSRLTVHG